jgi:hypothetical protein
MGMFDWLVCEYPLPDGLDTTDRMFQTQDTPHQAMERYVLRADGTLLYAPVYAVLVEGAPWRRVAEVPAVVLFDGPLTFYTGNIVATAPWGVATEDDIPPWWAEYTGLFAQGHLLQLTGGKTAAAGGRPHLSRAAWDARCRQ